MPCRYLKFLKMLLIGTKIYSNNSSFVPFTGGQSQSVANTRWLGDDSMIIWMEINNWKIKPKCQGKWRG